VSKKWQALEFLDFKERQARRRVLDEKEQESLREAGPTTEQKGLRAVTVVAILLCVVTGVVYLAREQIKNLHERLFAGRTTITVEQVKGDAEATSASRATSPLLKDDHLTGGFTIKQGDLGRVVLNTFWKGTVAVLDKADVEFLPMTNYPDKPDLWKWPIRLRSGTILVRFKTVKSLLLDISLPQGARILGNTGVYRITAGESESALLVREGHPTVVMKNDKSKKTAVRNDERLAITSSGWDKPQQYRTPETFWK
jgi:hypothetical protein